jgi:hypothetical protein
VVLAVVGPSYGFNFPWQEKKPTVGEKVSEAARDLKFKAESTKEKVVDKVNDWKHTTSETVKDLKDFNRGGKRDLELRAEEAMDRAKAEMHHAAHRVDEKLRDAKDSVFDKAEEAGHRLFTKAHDAKEKVEDKAEQAKEYLEPMANDAKEYLEERAREGKTAIDQAGHPILIGVASITCLILGSYFFFAFKDDAMERWEATRDYGKLKASEAKSFAKEKLNRAAEKSAHLKDEANEKIGEMKAKLRSHDAQDEMMES